MEDYNDLVLTCESLGDFGKARNQLLSQVSRDIRRKVNDISIYYLHYYGSQGRFDRMNNRSIGTIIDEFSSMESMRSVDSGEQDGVCFQLFESPENQEAGESSGGSQAPPVVG